MSTQVHDLRDHPFKIIYLLYEVIFTLLARVPWWACSNTLPSWRPRSSWSLVKTIMVYTITHLQYVATRTGAFIFIADHITPSVGPDVKQVWIEMAPDEFFTSELRAWMAVAQVKPARIPGYWIDRKKIKGNPIERIVLEKPSEERIGLFLHGGGYIRFSASPKDMLANIPRGILDHALPMTRMFSLEYRLSRCAPDVPANAFPAAFLDALAGYTYLTQILGVPPENILVLGDSAGGNLAHALTRYLVENANVVKGLPAPPGALLLLSPWTDLSKSHAPVWNPSGHVDYIGRPEMAAINQYALDALFGANGQRIAQSRYLSPASIDPHAEPASFIGFPRTMIVAGGAEALIQSIKTMRERMERDLGRLLTYYEADDAVHDYLIFTFWEPERTETLQAISQWIEDWARATREQCKESGSVDCYIH